MARRNDSTRGASYRRYYHPYEYHPYEYRISLHEQRIAQLSTQMFQINMQLVEIQTALGRLTRSIMELEAVRQPPPPVFNRRGCVRINVACQDTESSARQQPKPYNL